MKTKTAILILFGAISILAIVGLVSYFAPSTKIGSIKESAFASRDFRFGFEKTISKAPTNKIVQSRPTFEKTNNSLGTLLNSWQNKIEHATSAQISIPVTSSTSSQQKYTKNSTTNLPLGDILKRMNEQFRDAISSSTEQSQNPSITDDEIYSLVYYKSSVDLNQKSDSLGNAAIRQYGNELAKKLTTFRIQQGDQLIILDNFIKNSGSTIAQDKIEKLANAYKKLAKDITQTEIPKSVKNINTAIATSLTEMSTELWAMSTKKTDTDILAQANEYNKTSAGLAKNMLRLIDTFMFADVKFKSNEPGAIFMFK